MEIGPIDDGTDDDGHADNTEIENGWDPLDTSDPQTSPSSDAILWDFRL
ncbi:MAG: hypothetical protein ACFFAS_17195 [Promethearchaeota archaeon]